LIFHFQYCNAKTTNLHKFTSDKEPEI
jgi:hypothetical protein